MPAWLLKRFEGLDDDPETRKLIAAAVAAEQVTDLVIAAWGISISTPSTAPISSTPSAIFWGCAPARPKPPRNASQVKDARREAAPPAFRQKRVSDDD